MNNNSSNLGSQGMTPSDEQMDLLLHSFFRLEVPVELQEPLQFHRSVAGASVTVAPEHDHVGNKSQPRSVRFIAVAISVAAMAMAVLVVISANNSQPSNGNNLARGLLSDPAVTPAIDNPMLVSPEGDLKGAKPVSPDGVTLEEMDGIELNQ